MTFVHKLNIVLDIATDVEVRVIEVRPVHPLNALPPIDVTDDGMFKDIRPVQP